MSDGQMDGQMDLPFEGEGEGEAEAEPLVPRPSPLVFESADSYWMDEDEIVFMSAGCGCCSESHRIELDTPGNKSNAIAVLEDMLDSNRKERESIEATIASLKEATG